MKKLNTLTLAWVVAVVIGVATTASANAAEWSIKGAPVTTPTSVTTTGLLTLTDLKASFLGASAVDCEATLVGTVSPAGKDETTEIIGTESKKTKGNGLAGEFIECKGVEGCEGNGLVYPVGLPWKTQLELVTEKVVDDTTSTSGHVGYVVECSIFGIKEEDECVQALTSATVENMVSEKDVLEAVHEENAATCSLPKENSGDLSGEGLVATVSGETLEANGNPAFEEEEPFAESFGTIKLGMASLPHTLKLKNNNNEESMYGAAVVDPGVGAGVFNIVGGTCSGKNFGPGAVCTVEVSFEPLADEAMTATLLLPFELLDNKGIGKAKGTLAFPISGTGN